MAAVSLIVTGDKEVNRRLAALEPKLQKKFARQATRAVAKKVAQEAKGLTPSISGRAKRTFKVRAIKRKVGVIGSQVIAGADERGGDSPYYLKFLELGKEGQPALKFLRGTLYDRANRWQREFEKELRRFIVAA